jgi:uncharacterized protein (DUF1778 family)
MSLLRPIKEQMENTIMDQQRDTSITIRAHTKQRSLIDAAASALGKSRTEFVLESSCQRAEDVLLDQRNFFLNDAEFDAFMDALDNPPPLSDKLKRFAERKAIWDK